MKFVIALLFFCLSIAGCKSPDVTSTSGPTVILKLDDAWYEDGLIHRGWIETFHYLNERGVTATIGIVGERMQEAPPEYYGWLKEQSTLGHEIWNHGWCHCKPVVDSVELREFRGMPYTYQLDNLRKTQELAREKLGLELTTFGAPYNAVDTVTVRAVAAVAALTAWFYAPASISTFIRVLPRNPALNIEYPVHQPDFASFLEGYRANKTKAVMVIQGHPRSWLKPESRLEEFKKIVEFLIGEGAYFVTPQEYLEATTTNKKLNTQD